MAGTVQHLGGEDKKRDRCLPRCQLIIGCVFSATVGQAAEGIEWNVRNNQDVELQQHAYTGDVSEAQRLLLLSNLSGKTSWLLCLLLNVVISNYYDCFQGKENLKGKEDGIWFQQSPKRNILRDGMAHEKPHMG
ncbi:hypothetical protein I7I51_07945 [Histoplasma capsulatum]|uniref:Uncharacterized protein n=1 Tax=Ajellomyces capsulatus TaxID=5037 RepID=A0A8A1LWH1_AJECA|nr:hypothetical protein I7I51_07945 [Histoplasma capsulatum]